jgi:DivIVA domain-containing protein
VERALTTAWFDEQNRMSPEELQTITFPFSRLGKRGYDEDAVREFLREVHGEFVRLVNDRTSLWQEVQRLRHRIIAGQTNGDSNGVLFGEADGHVHAVRILSAAQLTADRYVADAQAYSSRLTEEARTRRDEIMQEAQHYSDMVMEEAHARAREAAVSALEASPSPQTYQEQQAARAELAYLRTYSDVYRRHLRAYTEGILRGIEEWERTEATSLDDGAQDAPVFVLPLTDGNSNSNSSHKYHPAPE